MFRDIRRTREHTNQIREKCVELHKLANGYKSGPIISELTVLLPTYLGYLLINQSIYLSFIDTWCELLPTLTRTDEDIPSIYFLGATDKLFVIGGNNSENMVASFSVESQQWGKVTVGIYCFYQFRPC